MVVAFLLFIHEKCNRSNAWDSVNAFYFNTVVFYKTTDKKRHTYQTAANLTGILTANLELLP
jgi:hypothetical protein